MSRQEYGFVVRLEKPIEEYTEEELDNLDSDCYMLEDEVNKFRQVIDDETKRRRNIG